MKTICLVMLALVVVTTSFGQPREGRNFELSLSGSYQHYASGSSSSGSGALLVSPRLGYFVFKGLEVEPEIICLFGSSGDPVYMANGNLSYNFISDRPAVPFVLVGYGMANTVPVFGVPFTRTSFAIGVLNVGAGMKVFLHEDVALRLEYRYQAFTGEGEDTNIGYYAYTHKVEAYIHTVQFGFSVLL